MDIRVLVLRTVFRVVRLFDQRASQKKEEYCFSIFIENNSTRKSSQVNPREVEDVWAVELQSCAEFE